ncbi:MAG: prenyltransferase [Actinobacteria bacterium]|nr:prenyltransferase [Actinomycetota bacterium]MCL5445961.1 prenyltransferase [Actinomycetota bacterium]
MSRMLYGTLSEDEILETAQSIAVTQCKNGMIPWFEGGHSDPWNHVEAAMALSVAGMWEEATKAYEWLVTSQLPDGSWFNYYADGIGVVDQRIDTNVCAYIATGTWHHYLTTGDLGFLEWMWKVLDRAMTFVLRYQQENGTVLWSLDPDGHPGRYALLTGSSSIHHALRCAISCAETLGYDRLEWKMAANMLKKSLSRPDRNFEPKREFAMDWYYPALCGALEKHSAVNRIDAHWDTWVMEGLGVRCVSTGPWVTAAETAECSITLASLLQYDRAHDLLSWSKNLRCEDGSYWTGMVYPEEVTFPVNERTTYTAAAVILAADSLNATSPTGKLFAQPGV